MLLPTSPARSPEARASSAPCLGRTRLATGRPPRRGRRSRRARVRRGGARLHQVTRRRSAVDPAAVAVLRSRPHSVADYVPAAGPHRRGSDLPIVPPAGLPPGTKKGRPARDLPPFGGGYGFRSSGAPIPGAAGRSIKREVDVIHVAGARFFPAGDVVDVLVLPA